MTWTEILAGFAAVVGLVLSADRLMQRLLAGQYAKREELLEFKDMVKTEQMLRADSIKEAHHRVDLLGKVIEGLPGYPQFNDLKEDVAGIKQEVAVTGERLKGIGEDIHEMRKTLDELRDRGR